MTTSICGTSETKREQPICYKTALNSTEKRSPNFILPFRQVHKGWSKKIYHKVIGRVFLPPFIVGNKFAANYPLVIQSRASAFLELTYETFLCLNPLCLWPSGVYQPSATMGDPFKSPKQRYPCNNTIFPSHFLILCASGNVSLRWLHKIP